MLNYSSLIKPIAVPPLEEIAPHIAWAIKNPGLRWSIPLIEEARRLAALADVAKALRGPTLPHHRNTQRSLNHGQSHQN